MKSLSDIIKELNDKLGKDGIGITHMRLIIGLLERHILKVMILSSL